MMDELLISYLKTDANIASLTEEIAVGQVPIDADDELLVDTYIWLSMFDEVDSIDLDGETGLTEYRVDIECCSTNDVIAKRLARFVKKRLQGTVGDFGTIDIDGTPTAGSVQAVFVESKDDQYVPINQYSNHAITVVAIEAMIFADDSQDDLNGD